MTEENMTELRREGDKAFPDYTENDNSASSSEEETNIDQSGASDQDKKETENKNGDIDERLFNHPRWKERENDWKNRFNEQEKRHTDILQKMRDEFELKFAPKQEANEIPSWFGGEDKEWKEFVNWNNSLISKAKEEARAETLKEIESRTQEEQKKIDEATNYFNSEVAAMEQDKTLNPTGFKIDRNKLLKYTLDNKLCDTEGNWNYRAAFRELGAEKVFKIKEALNDRKKIANALNSENKAEQKKSAYTTSEDFAKPGNRPW